MIEVPSSIMKNFFRKSSLLPPPPDCALWICSYFFFSSSRFTIVSFLLVSVSADLCLPCIIVRQEKLSPISFVSARLFAEI